jgi:hypothetical protein
MPVASCPVAEHCFLKILGAKEKKERINYLKFKQNM